MNSDSTSDRLFHRLTWIVVALGILARLVRFAMPFPLWGDEVFVTQNFLDRDYRTILNQLDHGQICPPLFLWLQLAAFKLWGGGEQAMRALPLLAGILGLLGFARLAVRWLPAFPAFLAVGFLSVAIWPVCLSTFAKPYSFDLFAAVAVLTATAHWHQKPESVGWGYLFALVLPVAMLASYTTAFVAGAGLLVLLPVVWPQGPRLWVPYCLAGAGLFAAFAFVLTVGKAQLDTPDIPIKDFLYDYWRHGFPPEAWWQWPLWLLKGLTGRMFAYPVGDGNGGSTLTFLMVVLGAWAWWRAYPRWQFVLLVGPVVLNFLAALVWKYPFGACGRLSQYAAPSICLFAGLGTTTFFGWVLKSARAYRVLAWVYTLAFTGLAIGFMVSAVLEPYHDLEAKWVRDTVQEFAAVVQRGDEVVMCVPDNSEVPIPHWHFRLLKHPVSWAGAWPENTAAKRVWIVDYWQAPRAAVRHTPAVSIPPGWKLVEKAAKKEFIFPEPDDEKLTLVIERYERE